MTKPLKVLTILGPEDRMATLLDSLPRPAAVEGQPEVHLLTGETVPAEILEQLLGSVEVEPDAPIQKGDATHGNGDGGPGPAANPEAAILAQALKALAVPERAWDRLAQPERETLTSTLLTEIYRDRREHAKHARWLTSPELALLDLLDDAQQKAMAKSLLEARNGLTEADTKAAAARTATVTARNELLDEAQNLVKQIIEDRKTWRKLAWVSTGLLVLSVLVSIAALAVVLLGLADEPNFDAWSIPVIIFALAVFVVSPAALLLTEKPLKGINEWMPSGKASDEEKPAEEKKPAEKAGGAAGYTKGPGKPD